MDEVAATVFCVRFPFNKMVRFHGVDDTRHGRLVFVNLVAQLTLGNHVLFGKIEKHSPLFGCNLQTTANKVAVNGAVNSEEEPQNVTKDETLSEREKEIVRCIVNGLTNKEVAEKLFISVNTVLTHRKNIARKLSIHSTAGLTIYAIANGIVNLEDVQI